MKKIHVGFLLFISGIIYLLIFLTYWPFSPLSAFALYLIILGGAIVVVEG